MTSEKQKRIDAITLIIENGCAGIDCDDCPLGNDERIKRDLCLSIEEFC